MLLIEKLADFGYSISKTLSEYTLMSEQEAEEFTKNMTLSDYLSLTNALDSEDEEEVSNIVNKYLENENVAESFDYFSIEKSDSILESSFMNFIENASIKQIAEAKIFSNIDIQEIGTYKHFTPRLVHEALDLLEGMGFQETIESVKFFKEAAPYKVARDIFITTYVIENINNDLKQSLSKLTKKPPNTITNPSYTDPVTKKKENIVSANTQNNTIAVQDDKGEVEIIDVRDQNKMKQIATESLKRLAGIV